MLRTDEILSTIEMLHAEHLDVRAVTLAINVDDCAAPNVEHLCRKLSGKITSRAQRLVEICDRIGVKYGIPVTNKRIAISPVSTILAGHGRAAAVQVAKTLDRAALDCRVDFVGGFSALVHKGISAGDDVVMSSLPDVLAQTHRVCASVNVASRRAGINMDAVHQIGHVIKRIAEATAAQRGFGCAKLVVFANIPEDNPFMAGAYMGSGEPEAAVNIGVSGPGVVGSALKRRIAIEPNLTIEMKTGNDYGQEEDDTFIDAILDGDQSLVLSPYSEAVRDLQVVLAANESMDNGGKVVVLKDTPACGCCPGT